MEIVKFSWENADYRIISPNPEINKSEIKKQRALIENYILSHPEFKTALEPLKLYNDAPDIEKRMHRASILTDVGPMASVAGTIAQYSAEASIKIGDTGAIIETA